MNLLSAIYITIISAALLSGNVSANEQITEDHCGTGEVMSILNAVQPMFKHVVTAPDEIKIGGLGNSPNCQYRLFLSHKPSPEATWAFCTEEVFLGGVVLGDPYANLGITYRESVEFLEALSSEVYFGPLIGLLTERPLIRTNYKSIRDPQDGQIAWFQEAFISQEEPGLYLSRWSLSFFGSIVAVVNSEIEIVTHEEHLNRVDNGTWRTWYPDAWSF